MGRRTGCRAAGLKVAMYTLMIPYAFLRDHRLKKFSDYFFLAIAGYASAPSGRDATGKRNTLHR